MSSWSLKRHLIQHTGERIPCDQCNIGVISCGELNRHIREKHPFEEIPLPCAACNKSFAEPKQLNEHRKSFHNLTRIFVCNIVTCRKFFDKYEALCLHKLDVHQIKLTMLKKKKQKEADIKETCIPGETTILLKVRFALFLICFFHLKNNWFNHF